MTALANSAAELSRPATSDLREVVERLLERRFPSRIAAFRRRQSSYSSTARIENLFLQLATGRRLQLVFKDLSRSARLPSARDVRPSLVDLPEREILVYRNILSSAPLGTALYYGDHVVEVDDRCWLFLERVPGRPLWQTGRRATWEAAAQWLARLHAHTALGRAPVARSTLLLRYDSRFYNAWMLRALQFGPLRRYGPARDRSTLERIAARYDRVVAYLTSLPRVFIHGECYPSNVMVNRTTAKDIICPIDWEMAALGPGAMDLAALTSGRLASSRRAAMIASYHAAAWQHSAHRMTLEELTEAVDHCQLHLAVQMLGWSSGWTPPAEHAEDWLAVARRAATRVGIRS